MTKDHSTPTRRRVLKHGALATSGVALGLAASGNAAAATTDPQGAIDSATPGDTVTVADGTYDGTLTVDVDDLTLRAANPGGATIAGSDSETAAAVSIEADGVSVDGFEVTNDGGLLGIKVQPGYVDVTVRNNHVHTVGPVGRLGATGIIGGGPHDDLTVAGNVVENVVNEVNEDSGYPTTNGIFVDDEASGSLTNSAIRDNVVRNLRSDVASLGIILGIDADGVEVSGNEVTGLVADPATDSDTGDDDANFVTYAQGLNVSRGTENVVFRENVVDDVTATYFVGTGLKVDGEADGLTVTENDLLPTVGVENADDDAVAATCNYWGHPKGPREVDGNRDADDGPNQQGRAAVVGPVEYEPWSVRSIEDGENQDNSCVGGRGRKR